MGNEMDIFVAPDKDWLEALAEPERNHLKQMLETLAPEQAAELWIVEAQGMQHHGLVKKKGEVAREAGHHIFARLKTEFDMFICDHPSYAEMRKKVLATMQKSRSSAVATIAGALAATVHVGAAILAPAIVSLLIAFGKIGKEAYCKGVQIQGALKQTPKK
jgi:hypothetical protein